MRSMRCLFWSSSAVLVAGALAGCAHSPTPNSPVAAVASAPPGSVAVVVSDTEEDTVFHISPADPSLGARDALVTIVVFSDFQCPFCARLESTMRSLRSAYADSDLRIVWKNLPLPFHEHAKPAAEAAMAAQALGGSKAFFCFSQGLFDKQQDLGPELFGKLATQCGLSVAALQAEIASQRPARKIALDMQLAQAIGVDGTPQSYVNGQALSGAQPLDAFKTAIDAELGAARKALAAGTARSHLHAERVAANYQPEQPGADEAADQPPADAQVYKVPIGSSPVLGPAAAPVTIVVFSDFQCPFCKRAAATLQQVRTHYGDQVRIVFKNNPLSFHPRAEPAAQLAMEAKAEKGDDGFWKAHDAIFDASPDLDDAKLREIGTKLGLNPKKVEQAIASHKHQSAIDTDARLAEDLEATGTPQFFINGRRLMGAQPAEAFQALIDELLPQAKKLVQDGTPAVKVYDKIVEKGVSSTAPAADTTVYKADVGKSPVLGPAAAPVTVVVFSDFQCPFCKRVEDTLAELRKRYPNKIRFVFKNYPLPFHARAEAAAVLALEARAQKGEAAYWKAHDALFASAPKLEDSDLDAIAKELGMDLDKLHKAQADGRHRAQIDADKAQAEQLGVNGTPAFFVNGRVLTGAQPIGKFSRLVDDGLQAAAALSKKGVSAGKVYEEMIKTGSPVRHPQEH